MTPAIFLFAGESTAVLKIFTDKADKGLHGRRTVGHGGYRHSQLHILGWVQRELFHREVPHMGAEFIGDKDPHVL